MDTNEKLWWVFGFTVTFLVAGIIVLWSIETHDSAVHHHQENVARIKACQDKPDFAGCVRASDRGGD